MRVYALTRLFYVSVLHLASKKMHYCVIFRPFLRPLENILAFLKNIA